MKTLPIAVALAVLCGCASQSTQDASTSSTESAATRTPGAAAAAPAPSRVVASQQAQLKTIPDKNSVFYSYDRSEITPEGKKLVEAHAQYLRAHPETKVRIEGNADERGSAEYNLALGQRRADSVMSMMTLLGIPKDRIETVSFGKEKPKATGHEESAWSANRRSDILYH